jgi:predicted nucleic acid-binding protein
LGIGHGVWGIALSPPSPPLYTPQLRDLDDTVILKTAVAANVEVIVTSDLDLSVLTEFNAIPI